MFYISAYPFFDRDENDVKTRQNVSEKGHRRQSVGIETSEIKFIGNTAEIKYLSDIKPSTTPLSRNSQ